MFRPVVLVGSLEVLTTNMEEAHISGKVFRTHLEHLFDGGRDGNRIVEVICEQHQHGRKAFRDVVRTRYLRKVCHMQTSKSFQMFTAICLPQSC